MSAVPAMALTNTETWLSPISVDGLHQFSRMLHQNAVLEWSELRRWLDDIPWMRLVKRVNDGNIDTLVLCGFYRIVKDGHTGAITLQRKTMVINESHQPTWEWVKTAYAPKFTLQSCTSSWFIVFEAVLTHVLEALFKDIVKQGVTLVAVNNRSTKKKKQGVVVPFESFDVRTLRTHFIDINESWGRELLVNRMTKQLSILSESSKFASRHLYKHLWDFVDRRYLSLFMKITQKALSEVYFGDVHRLYQSKLDLEYMQENTRWLPWLTVMNKEKKTDYAAPNLFSYDYLLPKLACKVSRNSVRKINRQPRKTQWWLINHLQDLPTYLPLFDALRDYPSGIALSLIKKMKDSVEHICHHEDQPQPSDDVFLRVVQCWAHYFLSMVGQVKVRKHQEQWQRALGQFEDIWTWVLRRNYPVQKNQSWYSLVQRHDLWIEEINERNAAQEAELHAYLWGAASVNYDTLNRKEVVIEEINHGARLHQEGKEMDHCVWSYLRECKKQGYRVFSLRSPIERATLGLYMNSVTLKCRYDQLRGPNNGMVSNHMQQLAKRLIKQINTEMATN